MPTNIANPSANARDLSVICVWTLVGLMLTAFLTVGLAAQSGTWGKRSPRGKIMSQPLRDQAVAVTPEPILKIATSFRAAPMTSSNAMIIRKAQEDFAQGNVPAVFAAFDPSITWHVPGHSPLSGDCTGHDQVGSFFQRTMELSGGMFSIDVQNVLAEGDLVVVLATVRFSESFPEVHVWQMRDEKAVEFREYQGDEHREDRFWS